MGVITTIAITTDYIDMNNNVKTQQDITTRNKDKTIKDVRPLDTIPHLKEDHTLLRHKEHIQHHRKDHILLQAAKHRLGHLQVEEAVVNQEEGDKQNGNC